MLDSLTLNLEMAHFASITEVCRARAKLALCETDFILEHSLVH